MVETINAPMYSEVIIPGEPVEETDKRELVIYRKGNKTVVGFVFKLEFDDDERKVLLEEVAHLFDNRQFESLVERHALPTTWKTSVMGAIARLLEANPLELATLYQTLLNPPRLKDD